MNCMKCGGELYRAITNIREGYAGTPPQQETNGNIRAMICRKCGYIELYRA